MGLLNHLFGSTESAAQALELDQRRVLAAWRKYLATIPIKKVLLDSLNTGKNNRKDFLKLKSLLRLELIDLTLQQKEESALISELEFLEHSQNIKRIQNLERGLRYVETRYDYAYQLLQQLSSILQYQMHLVAALSKGSRKQKRLLSILTIQFRLELEIITRIEKIDSFPELFLALVRGEHRIRTMDAGEKKLLKRLQTSTNRIFSREITSGITHQWALGVLNAIEDKVHEAVVQGILPGVHPEVDFEFVNRPEFVALARETILSLRKKNVSEPLITVLVHCFREWYNQLDNN